MSKTGSWVLDMQEDAARMNREEFVDVYGTHYIALWDEVNGFGWLEPDWEPDYDCGT